MEETVLCEPSEYAEHLEATRAFAHAHPNYSFSLIKRTSLNALQVSLRGSSCAIVAKAKGPALVLAIYHPHRRNHRKPRHARRRRRLAVAPQHSPLGRIGASGICHEQNLQYGSLTRAAYAPMSTPSQS